MKQLVNSLALTATLSTSTFAASLAVSPDLTIDTTGSDPGNLSNPSVLTGIETDFPQLVGQLINFQNRTDQGVQDIVFTVNSGSTVTSFNQVVIYGLQSNLTLTAATAADGSTPVTFSVLGSPAPSEISGSGGVGSVIVGSVGTAGSGRFAGSGGNDEQGVGIIQFNTPITSFTLEDIQPLPGATGNVFDNVFVTVIDPTTVPEPSSIVLLGLSATAFCFRRKR